MKCVCCMNKFAIIVASLSLTLPAFAQPRNCLRIMPVDELSRTAALIARVKVHRTQKINYRGSYNQLATLRPVDVIEGDFTLKEMSVLARSNIQCAEDNYTTNQEMLVFLVPEEGLYHTVNYQFGQFQIEGDIVKAWRDRANKPIDRPYGDVRVEVENYVNAAHTPKPEGALAGPQPLSPQPSDSPRAVPAPNAAPPPTTPSAATIPQGKAKRRTPD